MEVIGASFPIVIIVKRRLNRAFNLNLVWENGEQLLLLVVNPSIIWKTTYDKSNVFTH